MQHVCVQQYDKASDPSAIPWWWLGLEDQANTMVWQEQQDA
jgi:hypothetical protein